MRNLLITILSCTFYYTPAQNFSVSAFKHNVFYIGVDNPLSILVENYPSGQVVVKTTKGEVYGKGPIHIYRGVEAGYTSIILYKKDELTEIGHNNFRVKYMPDPIAKVGPSAGGKIKKIVLQNQQFIRADLENFDFDVRFGLDSFTFNIIRTDTCFFRKLFNVSTTFSNDLAEALNMIKTNDMVIFKNIYAKSPDRRTLLLNPVVFSIIN